MTEPEMTGRQSRIAATYKGLDVEEVIDIHFYRPIGYAIALAR